MKASLKELGQSIKAKPLTTAAVANLTREEAPKTWAQAQTRIATRQISGHYAADDVQAFRILAAEQDKDVQELLAEALNMVFERYGRPNRIAATSGRRKKRDA